MAHFARQGRTPELTLRGAEPPTTTVRRRPTGQPPLAVAALRDTERTPTHVAFHNLADELKFADRFPRASGAPEQPRYAR